MKTLFFILIFYPGNNCFSQTIIYDSLKHDSLHKITAVKEISRRNSGITSLIIPAAFITYGFVTLKTKGLKQLDKNTQFEITEDHPKFITKIDNYLQYSPAFAVYGLNALGVKGKNNLNDRSMIYGLSSIISAATVLSLKRLTKIERPDGSGANSFPSGHTTTAFAAAEFLRQEYKDVSPWYGITGYTAAAATGIVRLYNNKHWVSDVIAGAGFGIVSTKFAYWIYPVIKRKFFKNKNTSALFVPYYQSGVGGLAVAYNFNH
jgi:hypothetical protein